MWNREDFAVFILTHGRADRVVTYDTLRKNNYTGPIYLMVDDEDEQAEDYIEKYGDQVKIFNKQTAIDMTDELDNLKKRNSVVFARNYNFILAKEMGLKYFLQLDDDYNSFWNTFDNDRRYITAHRKIQSLDRTFEAMLDFCIDSNAHAVCMSQGGDFIGGEGSKVAKLWREGTWSRKAMNAYFFNVDKPFKFMGRINEDVNAYVMLGNRGHLYLTVPRIRLEQIQTQQNEGGLTDIYLDVGTYVKSFYSVMCAPSCVKVAKMGVTNMRLHHLVQWKYAVPQIVSEEIKKAS
jgi:hypothetical protein